MLLHKNLRKVPMASVGICGDITGRTLATEISACSHSFLKFIRQPLQLDSGVIFVGLLEGPYYMPYLMSRVTVFVCYVLAPESYYEEK